MAATPILFAVIRVAACRECYPEQEARTSSGRSYCEHRTNEQGLVRANGTWLSSSAAVPQPELHARKQRRSAGGGHGACHYTQRPLQLHGKTHLSQPLPNDGDKHGRACERHGQCELGRQRWCRRPSTSTSTSSRDKYQSQRGSWQWKTAALALAVTDASVTHADEEAEARAGSHRRRDETGNDEGGGALTLTARKLSLVPNLRTAGAVATSAIN
jgi:hypothetical protein